MKDILNENTENFDTDGVTENTPEEPQRGNDDYGDDFESQTGENNPSVYYSRKDAKKASEKSANSGTNNEKLIIFAAAALIVFVAGLLIFALTYNDKGKVDPSLNTVPTNAVVTTVADYEDEDDNYYEEETQYQEIETTEEPTEAETTEYVEPTTEYVEEPTQGYTEEYTEPVTEYIEEPTYADEIVVEETTEQIV